jgi:hypothetical protein
MPLGSLGRRVLIATVVAVITAGASACVFDLDPPVTCESVAAEDCDRAVEMARPLLDAYWEQASEVLVHPGPCSRERSCPPRLARDAGWLTVELVSDQPEAAFVVIDRHTPEWTAECAVTVATATGAHGEACAQP